MNKSCSKLMIIYFNTYIFYQTLIIPFIEEIFQITLDRKILTEQNIKNILNAVPQHTTKILN